MSIRAKLRVDHIIHTHYSKDGPPYSVVHLVTQYDESIPEDQRFQKATPTGRMEMQIDNPAALEQFVPGKTFYLDFTPVE